MGNDGTRRVDTGAVALATGVDRSTVLRWCREGLIDARQLPGGLWRIAVDDEGFPVRVERD